MNSQKKMVKVGPDDAGKRIDVLLFDHGIGTSKRNVKSLMDEGAVRINGVVERFATKKASEGDKIEVLMASSEKENGKAQGQDAKRSSAQSIRAFRGIDDFDDHVIYEDDSVMVFNKPPGLASQETKDPSVPHVLSEVEKARGSRFWLCHRLDKETSGALILAKSKKASEKIYAQFKHKNVKKTYYAVVSPVPSEKSWTEKAFLSPIGKKSRRVDVVRSGGQPSHTEFDLVRANRSEGVALVRCRPITGRTHQIRVHLEKAGSPIVGDKVYGNGKWRELSPALARVASAHHFLHAMEIEFTPPDLGEPIRFYATFPKNFVNIIKRTGIAPPKLLKFE